MNKLRVFALGGVGEIGKNCYVVEQGEDAIVIDAGLSFPNEEMFGVDIVIPDFSYLVERKDNIRGVFLTHAHEDHVGSLPYLLQQIDVPVYATAFTHALIQSKLDEKFDIRKLRLHTFEPGDVIQAGSMTVHPIRVTHSIPDTCAMAIGTEHGYVLFTSDYKLDFTPVDKKLTDLAKFGELGNEGVVLLLSDSTNVDRPGWGPSEQNVSAGLRRVFNQAKGRVLLTTFASNIHRMQQVYDVAAETGRVVGVVGRRMEQNVDICSRLGYLTIPKNTRVNLDELRKYDLEKQVILTTGSQGEPMSALVQMSREEYGRFQLIKGDTLIYSARPIPGNESSIWRTINRLFRLGVEVVYDPHAGEPVHVSGHAYREELKMMVNLTRPFYVAPVHGEPRHQHLYLEMARQMGYPEHRLFTLEEGRPLVIDDTQAFLDEPVPCGRVLVDNAGNPGVGDDILRDRSNLSRDGVVTITAVVDPEVGELIGDPIVQSKGFFAPEEAVAVIATQVADLILNMKPAEISDLDFVRHQVSDFTRRLIHKRFSLRPLVIASIVEV